MNSTWFRWTAAFAIVIFSLFSTAVHAQKKPNILIIWGDDIGQFNISAYNMGLMGYKTPNIDRIGKEGAIFTDWYGQQSCTAGRSAFLTGQNPYRTGLTKVGMPGADIGLQAEDATIAELLKAIRSPGSAGLVEVPYALLVRRSTGPVSGC